MELSSMLAGERFGDRPASVCPTIGAIVRMYNDNVDDARRQDLYRFASEAVGTRGDFALQRRRAEVAVEWGRARHELRKRRLRRLPPSPETDAGPDEVAYFVVSSLPRRATDESHAVVIALLDRLIGIVGELVEELPEPVEDRGRGSELFFFEVGELGVEARLDACPAGLDQVAPAVGQRGQDHAPVAV
jgi:hypothetical protein